MTCPTLLSAIVEALRSAGATDRRRRAQGGPRGEGPRGALAAKRAGKLARAWPAKLLRPHESTCSAIRNWVGFLFFMFGCTPVQGF
jgi:hypothetical protein